VITLHHHASAPSGQVRTDIRANGSEGQSPQAAEGLFAGPTIDVAKRLVGALLYRRIPQGEPDAGALLAGRIVETEAYLPLVDPSCHAYRGPTRRTATLFGRAGCAYVYLIYGMHHCLNVTTEPAGLGAAVLIRALEPLDGIDAMRRRRGERTPVAALTCGPGNLCRALSIDLRCDRAELRSGDLRIVPADPERPLSLAVTGRIGLNVAQHWPLRFFDAGSPSVSPFRKGRRTAHKGDPKCR
jgi:DNA-3-methyladenine glycosylase